MKYCKAFVMGVFACASIFTLQAAEPVKFVDWLKTYIPSTYPDVKVDDNGEWFQAKVPESKSTNVLVVSWAELTGEEHVGFTLKNMENSGLKEGKSIFIAKGSKEKWADSPSVVFYPDAGYYIPAYAAATMADWQVEHFTVVQYDGDCKEFSDGMAKAWVKAQKP
jgi:hypothetical protein